MITGSATTSWYCDEKKFKKKKKEGQKKTGVYFGNIENITNQIIKKYGENEYQNMFEGKNNNIKIDITYYPEINEYKGNRNVELKISNIRV